MQIDHDIHVHTFLSGCCGDEDSVPSKIIARAAETGLKTIGFADHMWDAAVPGASPWYAPQNYEHISQIREQLPADTNGVRILVGCESEYCGGGKVGISRAIAEKLDFVLLPMSHLHMKGFVEPEGIDTPQQVADLMVERYREVIELGLATGIAHPFLPCGHAEQTDEILSLITDPAFEDCFGRTAELGLSVEVSPGFFPGLGGGESEGRHDEAFVRMLWIAKQAGCVFHFASDAHTLEGVGRTQELVAYAQQAGITEDDLHPLARAR